ncbi:Abortive infection protein [Thalassoporum mexicanum PCC 7367]|nr:Abortive infection protein [Pseudanabaena sp. PCC 7367]
MIIPDRLTNKIANFAAPARLGLFLLTLAIVWLPFGAVPFLLFPENGDTAALVLLYIFFVALLWFWGSWIKKEPRPYAHYGLEFRPIAGFEYATGLILGLVGVSLLFGVQTWWGWFAISPGANWQAAILPGALTAFGVGFAEELLFRGWLLTELEQDYGQGRSLIASSLIFAALHFIRPIEAILATWVQFPGLFLLGADFVWARRTYQNRVGHAMGLHTGFVWGYFVIDVSDLLTATGQVPESITGIGGNPVAGLMGIIFLIITGLFIKVSYRIRMGTAKSKSLKDSI